MLVGVTMDVNDDGSNVVYNREEISRTDVYGRGILQRGYHIHV